LELASKTASAVGSAAVSGVDARRLLGRLAQVSRAGLDILLAKTLALNWAKASGVP